MSDGYIKTLFDIIETGNDVERNRAMKEFLPYVLGKKATRNDFTMMFKLIKDFGYKIVFWSLLDFRYSEVDTSGKYWGYIIAICKNRLMAETTSDTVVELGDSFIKELREAMIVDKNKREKLIEDIYD